MARAFKTTRTKRTWSPADIATLQRLFPTTHTITLARLLARPEISVRTKAALLGLQRAKSYTPPKRGPNRTGHAEPHVITLPSAEEIEFDEWLPRWKAAQVNRFNNRAYMRLPARPELYAVRVV